MQILSILVEIIIVIVAIKTAQLKKKSYAYGFAVTFAIYVIFDSVREFRVQVPQSLLDILFLIATVSALWAMWKLYKSK